MADFFLSDIHLRLDHPDRGWRLAKFVDSLQATDLLVIVGDLCDFWFATRQYQQNCLICPALLSLRNFQQRGGRLIILGGNHDYWLGSFYEQELGATWIADDLRMNSHGLQLQLTHGHRLGTRSIWKAAMESRLFFHAFGSLPSKLAEALDSKLEHSNQAHRADDDRKHIEIYRKIISKISGRCRFSRARSYPCRPGRDARAFANDDSRKLDRSNQLPAN